MTAGSSTASRRTCSRSRASRRSRGSRAAGARTPTGSPRHAAPRLWSRTESSTSRSSAPDVRVVLQNLWGRRGDWIARRSVLVEGLRELHPDLVALPEAVVNDEYDQVVEVLGPDFQVAHQAARESGDGDDVEPGQ